MGSHGSCGEEHPDRIGCPPPRGGLQASPVRSRTGRAPAGRGPRIARGWASRRTFRWNRLVRDGPSQGPAVAMAGVLWRAQPSPAASTRALC